MMDDRELKRLSEVYAERSDVELLALHESAKDLTDVAQQALAQVMHERGLEGESVEDAAGLAEAGDDEVVLWRFDDMFQANTAIQLLTDAEVDFRLVDLSQGGAVSVSFGWLQLKVKEKEYLAAKQLLQQGMGLFPEAEGDGFVAEDPGPMGDLMSVLMFDCEAELAEGLAAAKALGEAGISFVWHDGRDWPAGLADGKTVSLEVREASYRQAVSVVEGVTG